LFTSRTNLTSYDSAGHMEVYRYDANTGALVCVSCRADGLPPTSDSGLGGMNVDGSRVFFQTSEKLVPGDVNGTNDVYEYEGGRQYLISSGTGSDGSVFAGMGSDPSVTDVLFVTSDSLVPQDGNGPVFDGLYGSGKVYDARVGGGFPPPPAGGCGGVECRGVQSPAPVGVVPSGGSESPVAEGNLAGVSAPTRGKTVKKKVKKRKSGKHHKKAGRRGKVKRGKKSTRGRVSS